LPESKTLALETKIKSEQETLAALPPCPHCGDAAHVRKAGFGGRRNRRVAQFQCFSPQCNARWFLDPLRKFTPRGPHPNLDRVAVALRLRSRGLTYREVGEEMGISKQRARYLVNYELPQSADNPPLTGKLEVYLHPRTLTSFVKMYRAKYCREANSATLAQFAGHIIGQSVYAYEKAKRPDWKSITAIEK